MSNPRDYRAYLLRLWRAESAEGTVWRASLESPHTGECRAFPDLASLYAFLQGQTTVVDVKEQTEE
ncbi:MAG: hypothetical protein HY675_21985 [Chloroflexi bacterium]|nr:hypothetical protein [Chloroflexota bacterium]